MKSTARFLGHPIHPMLIPYPFAFLSGAAAFNIAAAARGDERLAQTARHLRSVGIASALAAALPGIVDYFGTVPAGKPRDQATKHALSNVSALGLFAASAMADRPGGRPGTATLALELAGTLLLSIGGWLGGELAYRHQIGVDPEEKPAMAPLEQRRALP
jgi:uncharacterized membrane protein